MLTSLAHLHHAVMQGWWNCSCSELYVHTMHCSVTLRYWLGIQQHCIAEVLSRVQSVYVSPSSLTSLPDILCDRFHLCYSHMLLIISAHIQCLKKLKKSQSVIRTFEMYFGTYVICRKLEWLEVFKCKKIFSCSYWAQLTPGPWLTLLRSYHRTNDRNNKNNSQLLCVDLLKFWNKLGSICNSFPKGNFRAAVILLSMSKYKMKEIVTEMIPSKTQAS